MHLLAGVLVHAQQPLQVQALQQQNDALQHRCMVIAGSIEYFIPIQKGLPKFQACHCTADVYGNNAALKLLIRSRDTPAHTLEQVTFDRNTCHARHKNPPKAQLPLCAPDNMRAVLA